MLSFSTIESFIGNYGYWALLIAIFFGGESTLIIAGLSAHLGLLQLLYRFKGSGHFYEGSKNVLGDLLKLQERFI